MIIRISSTAEKHFKNLAKLDQIILTKKIKSLAEVNQIYNEEKLKGYKDIYRIRIGHFRIVYKRTLSEVFIVLISHRKDVYNQLKNLF